MEGGIWILMNPSERVVQQLDFNMSNFNMSLCFWQWLASAKLLVENNWKILTTYFLKDLRQQGAAGGQHPGEKEPRVSSNLARLLPSRHLPSGDWETEQGAAGEMLGSWTEIWQFVGAGGTRAWVQDLPKIKSPINHLQAFRRNS